jgi:hypothetical protein
VEEAVETKFFSGFLLKPAIELTSGDISIARLQSF